MARITHGRFIGNPSEKSANPVCKPGAKKGGVTDGTRTRNSQNHNLELYH